MSTSPVLGSGRETRLLVLVIVVAVAMLLVLAQFRYPTQDRVAAAVAAGPIERLAARATFEELALIMADLSARVQDDLAVIVLERIPQARSAEPTERRFVAALRVDSDLAVAHLPAGFRVMPGTDVAIEDSERALVLVRVEPGTFTAVGPVAPGIGGAGYVAVFEGARGGPAVRPVFIGRVDSFGDPRWTTPLLAAGGDLSLRAGAFIYTLDGRLIGMATDDDGAGVAIVRVPALLAAVEVLRLQ